VILVDSSVWIDYFRGAPSAEADHLDGLLGIQPLLIGDLILTEILQGFDKDSDFRQARTLLEALPIVPLAGKEIAVRAAQNHRILRQKGVTVRKTIDTIIATCCIQNDYALLHRDQDFKAFERHLGLRSAIPAS
jgi:predicted nucleic acid-binding protein